MGATCVTDEKAATGRRQWVIIGDCQTHYTISRHFVAQFPVNMFFVFIVLLWYCCFLFFYKSRMLVHTSTAFAVTSMFASSMRLTTAVTI